MTLFPTLAHTSADSVSGCSDFLSSALIAAPVVDIDGTVFIQGGLFLLLVALLQPLLFKPWLEVQAKRTQQIDGAMKKASELEAKATKTKAECEAKLTAARNAAMAHRSDVRGTHEDEAEEVLADARFEANEKLAKERKRLDGELAEARTSLESKVDELAADIAAKVLGRSA